MEDVDALIDKFPAVHDPLLQDKLREFGWCVERLRQSTGTGHAGSAKELSDLSRDIRLQLGQVARADPGTVIGIIDLFRIGASWIDAYKGEGCALHQMDILKRAEILRSALEQA